MMNRHETIIKRYNCRHTTQACAKTEMKHMTWRNSLLYETATPPKADGHD